MFGATSARLGELYAALGACDLARDDRDGARDHFAQALRLDPRLAPALVGPRADAGDTRPTTRFRRSPPTSRSRSIAPPHSSRSSAAPPHAAELAAIAKSLHDRWRPDLDPALTVLVGRALFATGDRSPALANLFDGAIAHSSDEPNRTSLAAAIYLAQCDDPRAGQAARTAISLYPSDAPARPRRHAARARALQAPLSESVEALASARAEHPCPQALRLRKKAEGLGWWWQGLCGGVNNRASWLLSRIARGCSSAVDSRASAEWSCSVPRCAAAIHQRVTVHRPSAPTLAFAFVQMRSRSKTRFSMRM